MTCVWKALITGLRRAQKIENVSPLAFVQNLQRLNTPVTDVKINGTTLRKQEIEENVRHVSQFDAQSIRNGYLCSAWDPFVILVCHIYKVGIRHIFHNTPVRFHVPNATHVIHLSSTRTHMRFVRIERTSRHKS